MADKNAAAAVMKPATRAYVTLLANDGADDDSFKGVVGLAKGLRNAGSAYPLVVAVLPDVPESRRRILMDELGCVVREVQPVYPPHYNKLRVWEFVEYDQMIYLDAGIQGSLENVHEKFEPNHGPPPAPYVDADMFVYKPSMATARLLLHMIAVMMRPRTTIADHVMVWPRISIADHVMIRPRTTIADHQQAAASSSRQFSNSLTTDKEVMKVFFMAAVAVVTICLHYY
ncbi:galactinol synthase 2-like isoform X3 [Miscanthus floridulus]|uniref:galactinol synthase 2-like isoform X3 n=1 Tax=Miscanthus floridulus TaxID=154761 RepID=UPI003459F86A